MLSDIYVDWITSRKGHAKQNQTLKLVQYR